MKSFVNLVSILFLTSFWACTNLKNEILDFNDSSFVQSVLMSNGVIINNESLFLEYPRSIRFHPDSFLIIEETNAQNLIKIIDLKDGSVQELITQGRGPGEMLVPWGISLFGEDLYAFCAQLKRVIILTPDRNRKFEIIKELSIQETQTDRFYPLNTNLYICLDGNYDSDKRLIYLDNEGRIISKTGDFPEFVNPTEAIANNEIFSSSIAGRPDGEKFVLACRKTDIIEIYNTRKGLEKRLHGPIGIELTIHAQKVGPGFMIRTDPHYSTFRETIAGEDEFWVGFLGYKFEKGKQPPSAGAYHKIIYCFDWNGNPLRRILFRFPVISFDVDWDNKVLYTITWEREDPEIIYYPLEELL